MFEGRKFECLLEADENTQRTELNSEGPNNTGHEDVNTDVDRQTDRTLPCRLSAANLVALSAQL